MARTVVAVPLHNHERHLPEAIETLLGQSDPDLALVLLDDASTDSTPELARGYAERDQRVSFERLEQRHGLIEAWRRGRELALERHPEAAYFAWASDHDAWHPRWLETLAAELEAHPEAVLSYPLSLRIDDDGEIPRPNAPWRFDTAGVTDPRERFERFAQDGASGDMIYGLFRRDAVAPLPFRPLLGPDRLLLAELTVRGEFRQVPEILWYRRYVKKVTTAAQRASFFPGRVPLTGRTPWPLAHAAVLRRSLASANGSVPGVSAHESRDMVRNYVRIGYRNMFRKRVLRPVAMVYRGLPKWMRRAIYIAGVARARFRQLLAER